MQILNSSRSLTFWSADSPSSRWTCWAYETFAPRPRCRYWACAAASTLRETSSIGSRQVTLPIWTYRLGNASGGRADAASTQSHALT